MVWGHEVSCRNLLLLLFRRLENLERTQQRLVNTHHRASIIELSTVVGCGEQSHQLALGEELVTVFNDLMGTTNEIHVMLLQEPRNNIWPKGEGDTTVVLRPPSYIFVGVRPEQVAQQAAIGNLNN